ncbi:MAG: hypothetical protein J4432_04030 [DPANN group archaeon]|nr:hypothetical protein [DPANN group archaeon]
MMKGLKNGMKKGTRGMQRGQLMIIMALVLVFLTAQFIGVYVTDIATEQETQNSRIDTQSMIITNIEKELTLVVSMDPTNDTRIDEFINFSVDYAAQRGFDLNITT